MNVQRNSFFGVTLDLAAEVRRLYRMRLLLRLLRH